MCSINNIHSIEIIFFIAAIIFLFFIIILQPQNIIPYFIYLALYYIPINVIIIMVKNRNNIKMEDVEVAHRIFLILIGLIPIIGMFNKKTNMLIEFK
jgi:hypothetical protein